MKRIRTKRRKNTKIWKCNFGANQADRPWIRSNWKGKWTKSKDDRLNSFKSGVFKFLCFFECRIGSKTSKNWNATFERIEPIVLGFFRIGWESWPNPRTIGLIHSKVAFSIFCVFSNVESAEKIRKIETPLLSELSRSSLDSFELERKVDQIQGRSA